MTKETWLMKIAETVRLRATCPDLKVGCVIATVDGHVLSTGYNGVPRGELHCEVAPDGRCAENSPNPQHYRQHRVIHAEQNAVIQAAREGVRIKGSVAYVTERPCERCKAVLKQAGILAVVFRHEGAVESVSLSG